jgi:hypothetical protein
MEWETSQTTLLFVETGSTSSSNPLLAIKVTSSHTEERKTKRESGKGDVHL